MTAGLLRGEKPSGIPLEVPKLMRLVLNLNEAETMGIKVPLNLISDATRVIK